MATDGNDILTGTAGPDVLDGLAGDDYIDGLGAADEMTGGLGDDTFVVDSMYDTVFEGEDEGNDTIVSTTTYALPDNVENLRLAGTANISGYGNALGNELYGNSGMNSLFGFESGDLLDGGAGNDSLDSDGGDDFVYGGDGDDYIDSGDGNDLVDGGTGSDNLNGGLGDDTYVFGTGYGQDTAYDTGGFDRVLLAGGLTVSEVSIARIGDDVAVTINATGDSLLLSGWFFDDASRIESIEFGDGTILSSATIAAVVGNEAPTANNDFASAATGTATGNVLRNDSDPDEDRVTVANPGTYEGTYGTLVLAANGSYTYTLNPGLPAVQALGSDQIATDSFEYTATDGVPVFPGQATANLNVEVIGTNDAPVVAAPLADQSTQAGQAFQFSVPTGTFADVDAGDALVLGATLADGTSLPGWLAFDPATGAFSGTAPADAGGTTLEVVVTASDLFGAMASDSFALGIAAAPAGPAGGEGRHIVGTPRNDRLVGTPYDDTIDGRQGFDVMIGGRGDDTYFVDATSGRHRHGHHHHHHHGRHRHDRRIDQVVENPGEGHDVVYSKASYTLPAYVEDLHLLGGGNLDGTGNAQANWIEGNGGRNTLKGGAGDDLLQGGNGKDTLYGDAGLDVLQGGSGNDKLEDRAGGTVFDGGRGDDSMTGGRDADFFAGGRGNDVLRLGGGDDVIAFYKGDGTDRIEGERQDAVLVLGGVRYQDLLFRKDGADLVLDLGGHDRLVFDDWYRGKQSVATLEVVGAPSATHEVEVFDFRALVQAFDEARASARNMKSWKLMNELLDAHLAGSDDLALGGDLAHRYGMTGTLAGMGWSAARDTVAAPGFGSDLQALQPAAALGANAVKLGA
jgi:VCBS repeat-containing protein